LKSAKKVVVCAKTLDAPSTSIAAIREFFMFLSDLIEMEYTPSTQALGLPKNIKFGLTNGQEKVKNRSKSES
jgi:hypothetical protein